MVDEARVCMLETSMRDHVKRIDDDVKDLRHTDQMIHDRISKLEDTMSEKLENTAGRIDTKLDRLDEKASRVERRVLIISVLVAVGVIGGANAPTIFKLLGF